jgi:hypothetical protein
MTLNEQETRAAEVQILDSMSEDGMPEAILRSKVRWCVCACVCVCLCVCVCVCVCVTWGAPAQA